MDRNTSFSDFAKSWFGPDCDPEFLKKFDTDVMKKTSVRDVELSLIDAGMPMKEVSSGINSIIKNANNKSNEAFDKNDMKDINGSKKIEEKSFLEKEGYGFYLILIIFIFIISLFIAKIFFYFFL